ncbi:hypothetical protein H9P43_006255 [Blastocladiella emersonii ATCC 22665]|nr:hypothetical protein H9P43_006255 [Blastocladiella emersonii ATCC 22665]
MQVHRGHSPDVAGARCEQGRSRFGAVEAHLQRLNKRVARTGAAGVKSASLRGLAPVIVATIAVLANVGITSHLGINGRNLPPLPQLYNEVMAALSQRDGPLGKRFAKASRELIDKLYNDRVVRQIKQDSRIVDVPRDADYGIPDVAFLDHEE